jgi:hypothetical protein
MTNNWRVDTVDGAYLHNQSTWHVSTDGILYIYGTRGTERYCSAVYAAGKWITLQEVEK